ncbi:BtpA/SgcQ family protein [Georgenia yuyongxinii]|uniref:BtpA/SgcQ family protein n=1 Tax=Georgenia yuyongxinii TaxID=2589797 RepID=UPI00117A15C2|nr:BtpA/SgcQ family protein [Georgenia yuyongxinii]
MATTVSQVDVAVTCGVEGVFLINHGADYKQLVQCLAAVRDAHPSIVLGANFIRLGLAESLRTLAEDHDAAALVDALWTDDARKEWSPDGLDTIALMREKTGWRGAHFGGIAFKYQAPVSDTELEPLAALAADRTDVPTTSGPGTGKSADPSKLAAIRRGAGTTTPLAIASGVTTENIHSILPVVDFVLVATGIAAPDGRISPTRLREMLAVASNAG